MVLLCFILQGHSAEACTLVLVLSATHGTSTKVSRGEDKADEHAAGNGWKMAYTTSVEAAPEKNSAKSNKAPECKSMPAEAKDMFLSCLTLNFSRWRRNRKDLLGT